jgi:hypothetical protein
MEPSRFGQATSGVVGDNYLEFKHATLRIIRQCDNNSTIAATVTPDGPMTATMLDLAQRTVTKSSACPVSQNYPHFGTNFRFSSCRHACPTASIQ